MAVEVFTSFDQIANNSGSPLSGAKIYVYDVTTTTPKTLYSDSGLVTTAANPIVCDSAGRHDMRYIATGSYKVVVKTSADVTLYTRDNVDGRVPVGSGALAIANGGTGGVTAGAALSNLGAATAAELAAVAADVASLSGALSSTEKTHIATGSTAQRPAAPIEGDIRRNTTTSRLEHYNGSAWENVITSTEQVQAASQAQMEAAVSTTVYATPGLVGKHPGMAKAWGYVTYAAGAPTLQVAHNISSVTDTALGQCTMNLATSFSSALYCALACWMEVPGTFIGTIAVTDLAVGSYRIRNYGATNGADTTKTAVDYAFSTIAFGDQ